MADQEKIKAIIKFALLEAAQANKQLGVIHLLKYVYLVDLDYAKHNEGKAFTNTDWQFYKFGPWSNDLHNLVVASLVLVGATENKYPSDKHEKDCVRYKLNFDEKEYARIKKELGITVWGSVTKHVSTYYDDTTALLNNVYTTKPILLAAPREKLDLSVMSQGIPTSIDKEEFVPLLERVSKRKAKKIREEMDVLRQRFRNKPKKPVTYAPESEYGETYEQGMAWLDTLAGEPFPAESVEVCVDQEYWKSGARGENE